MMVVLYYLCSVVVAGVGVGVAEGEGTPGAQREVGGGGVRRGQGALGQTHLAKPRVQREKERLRLAAWIKACQTGCCRHTATGQLKQQQKRHKPNKQTHGETKEADDG